MDRIDNWPSALLRVVADATSVPFHWGRHDCVTFAADCVQAITGEDMLADLPNWDSALSALRVIEEVGGMASALTVRFGEPIPPAMAQRGDVGLLAAGDDRIEATGCTVVVCVGDVWVAPAADGLVRLPVSAVVQAWRVGR